MLKKSKKKRPKNLKMCVFPDRSMLSVTQCATICLTSEQTIRRWNRESWPQAYQLLCQLHANGRVMPPKWSHSRFNTHGNLELHNGEVAENEVLNIVYTRQLTASIRRELERQQRQIANLKGQINALDNSASNDAFISH